MDGRLTVKIFMRLDEKAHFNNKWAEMMYVQCVVNMYINKSNTL